MESVCLSCGIYH